MAKKDSFASEEFWDSLIFGNSTDIECELCGRVHYSTELEKISEEGEFEGFEKKRKENPDKYILYSENIHWGYIGNKVAVYNCPCNNAKKYENFILNNRQLISEYLTKVSQKRLNDAQRDVQIAKTIETAVNTLK